MLNRLLMAVHWVLFLWFLVVPITIILLVFDKALDVRGEDSWLVVGGLILSVVYVIVLWIIKSRWIWFPWQHDKD